MKVQQSIIIKYRIDLLFYQMHFPEKVYTWLIEEGVISNQGEIDTNGNVYLPNSQTMNFVNGYSVAELIKKQATKHKISMPESLAAVKADHSRSTKQTNWNFIWLALPEVGVQFDSRIRDLIIQGEQPLITQLIRQLHERDNSKLQNSSVSIKPRLSSKNKLGNGHVFDVKKIDFSKSPQDSESSLQFLILLLKSSLGMTLQQILGLFTNQNKYLAHLIVKGINQNFQPIVLFYSLLKKHSKKLNQFYRDSRKDAEACYHALKPGFTSKSAEVARLTILLFSELQGVFEWLTSSQSKSIGTLMFGMRRHSSLRPEYWKLLTGIIQDQQYQFFTAYYDKSFEDAVELVEITTCILQQLSKSHLKEQLINIGVIENWIQIAMRLPENEVEAQIIAFNFIGELMCFIPETVNQNQECMEVLKRNWKRRSLINFSILSNQLIAILERLGQQQSPMARKVYLILSDVIKQVGPGDKHDYLVQLFLPLISKFPTIPSEYFITKLNVQTLSSPELLLICQSIETNTHIQSFIEIGIFLRRLFIENPLLNFYTQTLLYQIGEKTIVDNKEGQQFLLGLIEEILYAYSIAFYKNKPKHKKNKQLYFGRNGSTQVVSQQQEAEMKIAEKWKQLYLQSVKSLINLAFSHRVESLKEQIKQKIIKIDQYIKFHNSNVGSKELYHLLLHKFGVNLQEKGENCSVKKSAVSEVDPIEKYSQITSEERKYLDYLQKAVQEKKMIEFRRKKVSKELQNSNLMRGQVSVAQISEEGLFQNVVHQPKELNLVPLEELQYRDEQEIELILKKYHKVLRHLFFLYTGTKYSSHIAPELIEDNLKRKETLTAVQLTQFLKDYRKFYLTSASQVSNMVRDINIRLLNRRIVSELDFRGFQLFIVQFCFINMTIPHEITTNTTVAKTISQKNIVGSEKVSKDLKGAHIKVIMKEFFKELKGTFVTRKENTDVFEDATDMNITSQQAEEVARLTSELKNNQNFILPTGFKKIVEQNMEYAYKISPKLTGLPQAFEVAFDALDYIFSKPPFNMHIMEDIAEKKDAYSVKVTALSSPEKIYPKDRVMSTLISRNPSALQKISKNVVFPKQIIAVLKKMSLEDKPVGEEVAVLLEELVGKVSEVFEAQKLKVESKPRKKALSTFKMEDKEQIRIRALSKKQEQKEEAKRLQKQKQRQEQKQRREHIAQFLQDQRLKMVQKRKKQEEIKQQKLREEEQKAALKKANAQKFKSFHEAQLQKIKKIEEEAVQMKKKQKMLALKQRQKLTEKNKNLKSQIEEQERQVIETHKNIENEIANLFRNQSIKQILKAYEVNLRALFDFLIANTHTIFKDKKHNNEIIAQTWTYFLNSFELSPIIVEPKDGSFMFKYLTRSKEVPKGYLVGLNFKDFQEALLRMAVKYKAFFNLIGERIAVRSESEAAENKPSPEKPSQSRLLSHPENEFDIEDVKIKELIKQNQEDKTQLNSYGDFSKVNEKTLKGLIHYLKVPKSKAGQQKRFREILTQKHQTFIQKTDRLKQKLSEEYAFLQSPKKNVKHVSPNSKIQQETEVVPK